MRRVVPWLSVGLLVGFAVGTVALSYAAAPHFFAVPSGGNTIAAGQLHTAVERTESVAGFTETIRATSGLTSVSFYQAPDKAFTRIGPCCAIEEITIGSTDYLSCGSHWEKFSASSGTVGQTIMEYLNVLKVAQRVERRESGYVAQYVPSFPDEKITVDVTVRGGMIVAEGVRVRYVPGSDVPYKSTGRTTVQFSRFDRSPGVVAPPRGGTTASLEAGAVYGGPYEPLVYTGDAYP